MRVRIGEARIRTVRRVTAEQDTTEGFCCGNVRVVVVAEKLCRTASNNRRHNLAVFPEDNLFDISLCTCFVPNVRITLVVGVIELRRVGAYKHF